VQSKVEVVSAVSLKRLHGGTRGYWTYTCSHAYLLVIFFGTTLFLGSTTSEIGSPLHWPVYSVPVASLGLATVFAAHGKFAIDRLQVRALVSFLFAAVLATEANQYIAFDSIRDVLIAAGAFVTFIPWFRVDDRAVKLLCVCFVATLGGEYVFHTGIMEGQQHADALDKVSFLHSKGLMKSITAFPLGVLAYYFFKTRAWAWLIVAVICQFVGFRRISLIALCATILVDLCVTGAAAIPGSRSRRLYVMALVACVVSTFAVSLYFNNVVAWLNSLFEWHVSLNAFTEGRYLINEVVQQIMAQEDLWHLIFGNGIGYSDELALSVTNGSVGHLHNDFMMLCLDYGLLGAPFVLFSFNIGYMRCIPAATNIVIYNCFLLVTDNTLIYYYHTVACFFVARALIDRNREGGLGRRPPPS
jgi:hypothetical protein